MIESKPLAEEKKKKALIASQNVADLFYLKEGLEKMGFEVFETSDGFEVIKKALAEKLDIIILDLFLLNLSTYQCCRLLKNDPNCNTIPTLILNSSESPMEEYWAINSGADGLLNLPVRFDELSKVASQVRNKIGKENIFFNIRETRRIPSNQEILSLANNLLEQKLFQTTILNEINLMDHSVNTMRDTVIAIMEIMRTLVHFSLAGVFLFSDLNGDLLVYPNEKVSKNQIKVFSRFILKYLCEQFQIQLAGKDINFTLLKTENVKMSQEEGPPPSESEFYIHPPQLPSSPCCFAAFQGVSLEQLREKDREDLFIALDQVISVLEKKFFFGQTQQFSIIDTITGYSSRAFFLKCLEREISYTKRYEIPLTLIVTDIQDFQNIRKKGTTIEINNLIRKVSKVILETARKVDIVARLKDSTFALLLPNTNPSQSIHLQERLKEEMKKRHWKLGGDEETIELNFKTAQFDPHLDSSTESFLRRIEPQLYESEETKGLFVKDDLAEIFLEDIV